MLLGLLIIGGLSAVTAIFSSFIISIFLGLVYICGLIVVFMYYRREGGILSKKIHFNLSLILKNENDKVFGLYGIKARPGYLSRWIELHSFIT